MALVAAGVHHRALWPRLSQLSIVSCGNTGVDFGDSEELSVEAGVRLFCRHLWSGAGDRMGVEFMQDGSATERQGDPRSLWPHNAICVSMRRPQPLYSGLGPWLSDINLRCTHPGVLALAAKSSPALASLRLVDIAPALACSTLEVLANTRGGFPCLAMLSLCFSETSVEEPVVVVVGSGTFTQGSFPSLRALSLRHCPLDVRQCLGSVAISPGSRPLLDCFEIHGSRNDVLQLADPAPCGLLPLARSLTLACLAMRHSADRAERFVGNMLGSSRCTARTESLRLTVISTRAIRSLGTSDMACTRLRVLELRVPLALCVASELLLKLPHLCRLSLPYVATEPALLLPVVVGVLSRSLQLLSMGFWDCRQGLAALSCAVVGFVAAIPSLLTLVHDSHVAAAVRRLVAGTKIPHLRNLLITDHAQTTF